MPETRNPQNLMEIIKNLQTEIENLKLEIKKFKDPPSGKISLAFIVPGALALAFSILKNSNILAFIGLGLTFWGALFLFTRPVRYVQSSLLDSTAMSAYKTIDRILQDLKFKGKSYYIPPYPKEAYLPEYLKGLKDPIVFISASEKSGMPSIDEIAKGKFLVKNPNGICLVPPGADLLAQIEKELGKDIMKLQLSELCESLPQIVVENLHLAREVEMKIEDNQIYKMLDPAYKNLYRTKNLINIHFLGCTLQAP